ncbi:hypothetical protein BMR1_02g02435 [Babesia microti strain RI]|uniref:Uncharacterized protein n=1 Tax=Babesia microti (strain RI) TaxID=1133968 RepID=A0A1R4AAG5_BABMR|nr:hypothetical protein BMR1_02g02435 [Babesia microti strain RI]SJK85999.1 hypothetical protein BMR1_02g02435 [Babesia microti strain RI]|eukprot:XP_021338198.1 hypothetical protein BMR1_02g02435 [Babesia microti strain RI]
MRPAKKYKSRIRKGDKNKCRSRRKLNSLNINVVSKIALKKQSKRRPGKQGSQQKVGQIETLDVGSLIDISSYRCAIAGLSNKAINEPDKCDNYIEPLFHIARKRGGGSDQTKSIAANLAIKSIGILLSCLSTSGADEESLRAKKALDEFSKILASKLTSNPVLVGLLVAKLVASDFRTPNDTILSLCLTCCSQSTYKQQSDEVTRAIGDNLEVVKSIFQLGSMSDCARVIKLINGLHKYSFNPQLISLIPLTNIRDREFSANAYFQFQFHKVSKDIREKLRYAAVNETPDVVAKYKKVILEQVLALYFKILKNPRVKSCELLITCLNGLCVFIQFLNLDIQKDILNQIICYQDRQVCPLVTLTSLDCAMKIMKYSQSSLMKADISWIFDSLIDKINLTDMPSGKNNDKSFTTEISIESNGCKDKLIKTLCVVMDHLGYFINPSCDIQRIAQLVSKLLCFTMLCDTTNAKILLTMVFNLVKKFPMLKDLFDEQGMVISGTGKFETCHWHIAALRCHFAPKIREFVAEQLSYCKNSTFDF